jgi:NADH-quinone oxidoreductase subunit H
MAQLITSILVAVTIMHVFLLGTAYLILLERKIAAWAQDRIGPNRVGPLGLLQPIADGLKFLMKEDYNPGSVDKTLFMLAPVLAIIPALLGWAVIPWGGQLSVAAFTLPAGLPLIGGLTVPAIDVNIGVADVNIGVIYILAIGSLAVYGISIGAWAANNKYAFLGGLRATAQMLSYEIPMGLCVLCILLMAGSAKPSDIIDTQAAYWHHLIPSWNLFQQPLAAILFFICSLAEANRAPFDLAECEQELIGGFHTEYSSMKFAMFFLGEYMHMATGSAFFAVMFLGGWHAPYLDYLLYGGAQPAVGGPIDVLIKVGVLLGKVTVLLAIMMWIRWTLPRFRFDQLMRLAWRGLIPISLALLLMTGYFVYMGWRDYLWVGNGLIALAVLFMSTRLPDPAPVNRRVPLAGSRFSPVTE